MTANALSLDERRNHIKWLAMTAAITLTLGVFGAAMVFGVAKPAAAALVPLEQCNNVGNTDIECHVVIVNTLTDDPATSGSVVTINDGAPVASNDIVTSVTQCNDSSNGGGAVVECSVDITNNIAMDGAVAAADVSINQCASNQPDDGLGSAPNTCDPYPATTSGATITQCNGSGNGGGLVNPSHCDAGGTASSALPITVNQCNDSANGGGTMVNCSTTITTNVVDTAVTPPTTPTLPAVPTPTVPGLPGTPGGPDGPGTGGPGTPDGGPPAIVTQDGERPPGDDVPSAPPVPAEPRLNG